MIETRFSVGAVPLRRSFESSWPSPGIALIGLGMDEQAAIGASSAASKIGRIRFTLLMACFPGLGIVRFGLALRRHGIIRRRC